MRIITLLIVLLICSIGLSSATSTYDVPSNTITVVNGTNYPWTVYSDVSNSTAFERTGNTSIVTANISIEPGATLFINDETWKFNCSSDGEYGLDSNDGILSIDNSTITVTDTNYRSSGLYSHGHTHRLDITNSELSYLGVEGVTIGINSQYSPDDTDLKSNISNNVIFNSSSGVRMWWHSNGTLIENNLIYNVTGQGIITQGNHPLNNTSIIINNNIIHDILGTSDSIGILSWAYDAIISNNTVYNIPQSISIGIIPKECGNVIVYNNTIYDIGSRGLYASYLNYEFPLIGNVVTNNTIYNAGYGMTADMESTDTTLIVSNNTVYDSGTGLDIMYAYNPTFTNNIWTDNNINIRFGGGDPTNAYFRNEQILNATSYGIRYQSNRAYNNTIFQDSTFNGNLYDIRFESDGALNLTLINTNYTSSSFVNGNSSILSYFYSDVQVQTNTSVAINNAVVTFVNNVDSSYKAINLTAFEFTSFTTSSDGHIPLPSNVTNSSAILFSKETAITTEYMNYSVTVGNVLETDLKTYSDGIPLKYTRTNSSSFLITPNINYLRSIPDTYQNTTTIQMFYKSFEYFNVVAS